jgi:uncharacterized protein YndB with AHSA1/START domain
MVSTDGEAAATTSDREIVITRVFDAPRELVFEAWTDPEQVVQWWGPHGFTTTIHEMDVRPGGVWLFTMHGPDGTDYGNRVVFVEVVKPERLVYDHGPEGQSNIKPFYVTVTFDDEDGKTHLTLRMVFESAAERDRAVEFGALEGGKQTLERLAQHLADRN